MSGERIVGFKVVTSDYQGIENIRGICPFTDAPDCAETVCDSDSVVAMNVVPGGGSVSQTIRLEDTISQQYGIADGTNFCGERSYEVFDTRDWISFDGTTLTLTSNDENDQPELVYPTIQMTLEGNTEPTCTV